MQKKIVLFILSLGFAMPIAMYGSGAHSATADTSRAANARASQARMISMPNMPGIASSGVGGGANMTVDLPTGTGGVTPGVCTNGQISTAGCPAGQVKVCVNGVWGPCTGGGTTGDDKCPDGTPKDSQYTVDACMNDLLSCVNGGVLPGGLNDLYNSDLRHSIMNGMNLCAGQVDYCIDNVKKDCVRIYNMFTDVWLDFNSRVIQPNYFAFVLKRTGLTPNQAENTCFLLDMNTFGSSFTAVSNTGQVTAEYNKEISAYNMTGAKGMTGERDTDLANRPNAASVTKGNTMGVLPNKGNPGVDGQRGHYARWDATTAECLVRVAAYNKDQMISNSWLFGIAGNDKQAEAWKPAGTSFSCGKDLFEFGLMNKTKTVAATGGAATVLGTGIAALAAPGKHDFDCNRPGDRDKLWSEIKANNVVGSLNLYMKDGEIKSSDKGLTLNSCRAIIDMQDIVSTAHADYCYNRGSSSQHKNTSTQQSSYTVMSDNRVVAQGSQATQSASLSFENNDDAGCSGRWQYLINGSHSLRCDSEVPECSDTADFTKAVDNLSGILNKLTILEGVRGQKLKAAAITLGVGAGATGIATAITAFVEKNQINCRVGDGLDRVAFNKSGKIDSLKDFYVKWNLALPETIMPTALVTDCESWQRACATLRDLTQCEDAAINFRPVGATTTKLIYNACKVSGSICIENNPIAVTNGACKKSGGGKPDKPKPYEPKPDDHHNDDFDRDHRENPGTGGNPYAGWNTGW